ncbi:proline--tRNA ligase [Subdoligranulum sp. CAG:314]|jgi:prolyl-tRNA synthetase, family I|nr:proline--tRNA ligase [Subdoligranulum sp.]CDE71798.1 proline--tRNA ligase [Subdoligranulum sp. CAG:314]
MKKEFVKEIADINADFPQWYTDVVIKTGLADYGPTKGSMVIRPYGYAIWENIQRELDARFKATGHKNAYFPLLIPMSLLQKEAEHVEGFAPEVATVTRAGSNELSEPLVVRPTSETIICDMYSRWIQSYRDLPLKINQWANVVRWEKTTRPFLRTSEFLWQEGHTVHATREEAEKETLDILHLYADFARDCLAMPVLIGQKTEKEKFAGAEETYGMEAMMQDGKSLQAGTTHHFGDKFARAYDIQFLDRDGTHKYAWQTSWGVSTRLIGALIMAHGDARGLILPPAVAPVQAIVLPIAIHKAGVEEAARSVIDRLVAAGVRCEGDFSDQTPGWKFNEWEMKGVPLRLEIGPRDIENGVVTVVRRDNGEKSVVKNEELEGVIKRLLSDVHESMYRKAEAFRDSRIKEAHTLDELKKYLDEGNFVKAMWCGSQECELKVKELMQATIRIMPFDQTPIDDKCIADGSPAKKLVIFARAY